MNRLVCLATVVAFFLGTGSGPLPAGLITTVMIGDDDGFGGTQGIDSNPGDSFTVFFTPSIAPGTYQDVAATDVTTTDPFTPYTFRFNFNWDTTSLSTIDSAEVMVQSGSVARRTDGSGFGFAAVSADSTSLGDFLTTGTGVAGSTEEETVKLHVFDVTPFMSAGTTGVLTWTADGAGLTNPADIFSLDFAKLVIEGTVVPEPSSLTLLGLGTIGLLVYGWRRKRKQAA